MKRGEIYIVDLHGHSGHEQQGKRPAIIVSNDKLNNNQRWRTVIVVPVSTSPTQAQRQYGVFLPRGSGGLNSDSTELCHQITTIDRARLEQRLGELDAKILQSLDAELSVILYL